MHQATNGNWTRAYVYNEASLIEPGKKNNRLSSTAVGQRTEAYTYDAHGNMTIMPHLSLMGWNYKDELSVTSRQAMNDTPPPEKVPETSFYVYDASGQRVRKVTERQNGTRKKERIYLGGFEIYRDFSSNGSDIKLERETLHMMDDKQRIALVETKTVDVEDGDTLLTPVIRYQLSNHLGSASLELDVDGAVISYEEYHPYGTTAYQAGRSVAEVGLKRYRYTGKERDEETGLGYHGARYYAPWLGRWTAADPIGIGDGINQYVYARNNPIVRYDLNGKSSGTSIQKLSNFVMDVVSVSTLGMTTQEIEKIGKKIEPQARYAIDEYRNQKKIKANKRTGGKNIQGHHPVQDKFAKENIIDYKSKDAPTQFLETGTGEEHTKITNDQRKNAPKNRNWKKKSTSSAISEATEQYKMAGLIDDQKKGIAAILESTGYLFSLSDEHRIDQEGKPVVTKNAKLNEQLQEAESLAQKAEKVAARKAKVVGALSSAAKNIGKGLGVIGIYFGLEATANAAEKGNYGEASFELFITSAGPVGDVVDVGRAGFDVGQGIAEYHGIYDRAISHAMASVKATKAAADYVGLSEDAGNKVSQVVGGFASFYSAGYQGLYYSFAPHEVYGMAYDLIFN